MYVIKLPIIDYSFLYLKLSKHTEISSLTNFSLALVIFRGSFSRTSSEYNAVIDGMSWRGAAKAAFILLNFIESTYIDVLVLLASTFTTNCYQHEYTKEWDACKYNNMYNTSREEKQKTY